MKLKFKHIVMHNFFCYDHTELDLDNLGYTVVSGVNNHKVDGAMSNGSGKSSIFNAICYALTGETAQGLKNNVENIYADPEDCWVELTFDADEDHFVIRRIKSPFSNMKIYINGVDMSGKGIKESTKILNDYLPDLTSMLIGSIIILGQGMPYRFTNNNPGGRKELLEKLTKSDYMIQSIRDRLDIRQAELKVQLRAYEDANVANDTKIGILNTQLASYESELKKLYDIPEEKFTNIQEQIEDAKDRIKRSTEAKDLHTEALVKINKELSDLLEDHYKSLSSLETLYNSNVASINDKMAYDKATINSLKKQIKTAESMPDICPTCGQKIPEDKKIDTKPLKEELEKVEADLRVQTMCKDERDRAKKKCIEEQTAGYNNACATLNTQKQDKEELIHSAEVSYKDWTIKLSELSKMELELKNITENRNRLKASLETGREELKKLAEEKLSNDANIVSTNEHLGVIQAMITLTKREFRGVLLENVIKYMNNKVKQYSQQVFGNDLLSFTLNENYIDIIFDGKYYEALSGGEKQKVDIIIQLALRELLSYNLGLHANILVLDEIFDNLDAVGCQSVMNLISNLNDIESVFIISHHVSDLQISYDTEIIVEKGDNGISKLNIH